MSDVMAIPASVRPARCRPPRLAAELRVSLTRIVRRLRVEKFDADLSDAQYSVLARLDREGAKTPGELAEAEHVQPPSMTRTLGSLTALGLTSRAANPDDGRQVLVTVTPSGRQTVVATRRRREAWLARRLADLSPQDREVLARAAAILGRLADS